MPKVSIVIPVFNGERFIGDAIENVLNQTFQDFEIIVVDDGSTDGTEKIVHQFSGSISYHRQQNQGTGVARNTGVSYSQGEWTAFLDADDVWYPHKLAVQIGHVGNHSEIAFFYSLTGLSLGSQIEKWYKVVPVSGYLLYWFTISADDRSARDVSLAPLNPVPGLRSFHLSWMLS